MDKKGGEYQDFPTKVSRRTVPKKFVGEPFRVSLISGIENFYASEGYVTTFDLLSKFFCLTVPKNFVGNPLVLCFRKFTVANKFMDKKGGSIKIFLRKFFVSQYRNIS